MISFQYFILIYMEAFAMYGSDLKSTASEGQCLKKLPPLFKKYGKILKERRSSCYQTARKY